ncbi:MAG TPA: hypothetical protein VMG12_43070 [Polyangiaceae bacterium]|nr:hypothetical protein [Polyangiaceae bacterium]
MVVNRFEAEQGWVAVSEDGAVWRYRGRASAGVLVFGRDTEAGLYQATHQDCFSKDTSLASSSWAAAVRFAVTGRAEELEPAVAAATAGEATPLGALETEARAGEGAVADPGGAPAAWPDGALAGSAAGSEAASDILERLPRLSRAERKEILDRLLHLETLDADA